MEGLRSTCRRDRFRRQGGHLSLAVPTLPCRFDAVDHLAAVEGLRQHVPNAHIQSFAPEAFVGKPGCDDQGWRMRQMPDTLQHVDPSYRRQIAFTKDNGNVMPMQQCQSRGKIIGFEEHPRRVANNSLHRKVVLFERTDGENSQCLHGTSCGSRRCCLDYGWLSHGGEPFSLAWPSAESGPLGWETPIVWSKGGVQPSTPRDFG